MPQLKAHFDGRAIILDEPAELAVGQVVRVIVEPDLAETAGAVVAPDRPAGPWAGKFRVVDECDDVVLEDFKDYLP